MSTEIAAEFEALRHGAAVSELDDRALLVVRGEDRKTFLQGMLSNEIASLESGQGIAALLLTEQGRVVADLRVYVLADAVWLDAPAAARDDVQAALERFIVADDVEMEHGASVGVAIRGPRAVAVAAAVAGDEIASLGRNEHRTAVVGDADVRAVRLTELGVETVHFWIDGPAGADLQNAFASAGATAVTEDALDAQRVVAGVGRLGSEFGLETLAPEVPSLDDAISYKKGCYLGQEVVERIAARGKVNWKIAVLRAGGAVSVGDPVSGADGEVGHVTSVARRPDDDTVWALARVRTTHSEPGTALTIAHEGGIENAEVVPPAPA